MRGERRHDELLIVFGKAAVPGEVKTRLVPPLTPDQAAELNRAFTLDTVLRQDRTYRDIRVCLGTRAADFQRFAGGLSSDLGEDVEIRSQTGEGLGHRMKHAFTVAFGEGYDRVVILGSDHPSLPPHYVDRAFESLRRGPAVCLGPATDGGYYLIGMDRLYPAAFRDMTYSHDRVLRDTVDRLRKASARIVCLDEWYDVDDEAGLMRLMEDRAAGRAPGLHFTGRVLDGLGVVMSAGREDGA